MPAGSTTALYGMPQPDEIFVDRGDLLDGIRAVLANASAAGRCAYVHLFGTSGVGKTELAYQLAAALSTAFPDGAWCAALGNIEGGVLVRPAAYLRDVLQHLGVDPAELTDDVGLLSARLRKEVAGKRVLIVVDDVVGPAVAEHFRFHAPGSLVILISRDRWDRLPSAYASFEVEPLKTHDAAELVRLRLGNRGVVCPPNVADRLVDGSGGLPQLIAVGAETLASLPTGSDDFLLRMVDGPVREGLLAKFRQTYSAAYDRISESAKRAYRLLSLHPLPEFSIDAATALVGAELGVTISLLTELRNKSLVHPTREGYRFHGSVWRDAGARREELDPAEVSRAAVTRMLWSYLEKVVSYELVLSDRWRVTEVFDQVSPACYLADRAAREATRDVALRWLEQNREILSLLVPLAHEWGFDQYAVAFAEALWSLLHLHNHVDDWRTTHEVALKSAERAGLPLPLMHLSLQLATLEIREGHLARAADLVDAAQQIAILEDHVFGQQSSLEWKARVFLESGDYQNAVRLYGESIEIAETRITDGRSRAVALGHFQRGRAYHRWRDHLPQAYADLDAALSYFQDSADRDNYGKILHEYGDALRHAGRAAEAMPRLELALSLFVAEDSRLSIRRVLASLIKTAEALGDQTAAQDYRLQLQELGR